MRIIFATQNAHKAEEVEALLGGQIEVMSLSQLDFHDELVESHETPEENALEKARFIYGRFGEDCFAEDTVLEVEALHGAPGVYSARFAGAQKSDGDNVKKLLKEMKGKVNRKAQFRTVIALLVDGKEFLCEGHIKGQIASTQKGDKGFGYDPVFIPDGYSETFAELGNEVKNKISHRAMAIQKMKSLFDSGFVLL